MVDLLRAVAVVEDQLFTRTLTVERLQQHFNGHVEVVGFERVEDLLAHRSRFDVIVLDLQLDAGGLEGVAAIRLLVGRGDRVLVFSGLRSAEVLERTRAAGASGFVSKDTADLTTLTSAIATVGSGGTYVDGALLDKIGATARKQLTTRQQEVLRLEALGRTMAQIARGLDPPLTDAGVRRHIERIVELYPDCAKQADRVRLAIHLGLISPWEVYRRPPNPPE